MTYHAPVLRLKTYLVQFFDHGEGKAATRLALMDGESILRDWRATPGSARQSHRAGTPWLFLGSDGATERGELPRCPGGQWDESDALEHVQRVCVSAAE